MAQRVYLLAIREDLVDLLSETVGSLKTAFRCKGGHEGTSRVPSTNVKSNDQELPAAVLDEIVRRVVAVAEPDRIVLFGSAARAEMGPGSDVDLLVIKSGVQHRRKLAQKIHRSFFGLGVSVDVIVVTPEDVRKYRDSVGAIIEPALREGREVYAV